VPDTAFAFPGVTVVDHPLIRVKLAEMRDVKTDSTAFRERLREIASLMVFEVTRDFSTEPTTVKTPLMECAGARLTRPVVVVPVLRAGLGMADGMLAALAGVSLGHIGMFRNEETLRPESYYSKLPAHIESAEVLVVDPMLATGWSATAAIGQLKKSGAGHIRFVCLVSCPEGLCQLHTAHPDVPVFTAVVDDRLNEKGYILPGLGDAGDRYFGTCPPATD
jgi:uracil phosphoribosyltransferase